IDAVGRENRVGDALRGILIVIEPSGAEGQIQVGDDRVHADVAGDGPGDVVGNGRSADAALGADHGDDAAERLGVEAGGKQPADRTHHVQRGDRPDEIFADTAADQLAIEHDVVDAAHHDDA